MLQINYDIILASKSPRRQKLLEDLGIEFSVKTKEVDESFPSNLKAAEIPLYLCAHKAASYSDELLSDKKLVITADTIVWIENGVLNKPVDFDDAERMLQLLSGKMHEVFTGVCLKSKDKTKTFYVRTEVYFNTLSQEQIKSYIHDFKPYDKAGSYGAQESLPAGMNPCYMLEIDFLKSINKLDIIEKNIQNHPSERGISLIDKINGSYFNVMGLPIKELVEELLNF